MMIKNIRNIIAIFVALVVVFPLYSQEAGKRVVLDKHVVSLNVKGTSSLAATVVPEDTVATPLTWTSGNRTIARIDSKGTITAVALGKTRIIVSPADGSGQADTCQVIVAPWGDINLDCVVDVEDVNGIIDIMLGNASRTAYNGLDDINRDRKVDVEDLSTVIELVLNQGQNEAELYARYNTPAISWIDDDFAAFNSKDQLIPVYEKLHDFCMEKGIRGDMALRPFSSPAESWVPAGRVAICQQWQDEGFSFLIHPNHAQGWYNRDVKYPHDATKITASALDCMKAFEIYGLKFPPILVWPGNSANFPDNHDYVRKIFECAIAATYEGVNHNADVDRYKIFRLSFESLSQGYLTKTEMKQRIKEAVDNGDWLILGSHFNTISSSMEPDETSYNLANVFELLEYAQSLCPLRPTGTVWNERKMMWMLLGR